MAKKRNKYGGDANQQNTPKNSCPDRDSSGNYIEVQSNPIREAGSTYIMMCGDKKPKELTNFVMRPISAIKGDCQHLTEIEFTLQNGTRFSEKIDSSAFVSVQKFKTAIKRFGGIEMRFNGNEQNLDDIQKYMTNKYRSFNHCTGLSCVGLHQIDGDWVYVGTDGAIDKKGRTVENVVSILEENKALDSGIIGVEMISRKELQELSADLFKFNTFDRTVNIIGWSCVCFLKERLRQRKIKLSHLVMAGVAGSGKSETLEKVVQPLFSLSGSGIGCKGITNFSVLKSTSSTNLLPIIFEEYKPHKLSPAELNTISGMLRSVYDCQTSQRGRADQSVVNYARRSPIIVVGESSFDEPAVKERIIDVQFAKSDRSGEHTRHFKSLVKKEKLLNKLGKGLLLLVLNMSDEDLDRQINLSQKFGECDVESRVALGMSNVLLGILLLQELYGEFHLDFMELTGLTEKIIIDSILGNVLKNGGKVNTAVDIIIRVFDTMAEKGRLRKGYDYIVDEKNNELCLRTKLIYDEFTKYVREFNILDVEVLTNNQFTKQLRKESYFKGYFLRTFKERIGDAEEQIRKRCYVLDLNEINKTCELEMFRCTSTGIVEGSDGFVHLDEENQVELPFEL